MSFRIGPASAAFPQRSCAVARNLVFSNCFMTQTKSDRQNSKPRQGVPLSYEDYLEAVFALEQVHDGGARVGEVAQALGVHKSTVTATLKMLDGRGLLAVERYGSARLTPAGRRIAERTAARHALIRGFLSQMLLLDEATADTNACRMEHVLDASVIERLETVARLTAEMPRVPARWRRTLGRYVAQRQEQPGPVAGEAVQP